MKKSVKIWIGLMSFWLYLPSCTKNLDLQPVSQISNASFWKTENDAVGALNGMYVRLRDPASTNFFLWGEGRSEVMSVGFGGSPGNSLYYDNTLTPTNSGPDWMTMYTVIHDANLILKYVPQIAFSSEVTKNNIIAQAYTMRAFIYFTMAKIWGDLIIVTDPTEGFNAEALQKERSPVADVFAFIKQDLTTAAGLFSNNNYPTGRNMWSLPALNALTADVYLWTAKRMNGGNADFTKALDALNTIDNSDVQLLPDFASVFDYTNKGNKEILMAVRFQELESIETGYSYMYVSSGNLPTNISDSTRQAIGALKYDAWTISNLVRNQFEPGDQRKNASIIEVYIIDGSGNKTYFNSVVSKFNGLVSGGVRLFVDDVILYRYADVLLMKAEAKNALGQDPSDEINKVRMRAYGPNYGGHEFVSGTAEENDAAILKERLLELMFEGKRWWDLVRFGKAFELVPSLQGRAGQDNLLLFPIPLTVLSLETKVKQNPGYN
ncbi:MAG TPA: RagB/SusD family nutrient uptake outer membrane protein [Chitinophagaceae bacterium]|jgi:hypothetical protein